MCRVPTYTTTAASVSVTRATSGQEPTSGVTGIHTSYCQEGCSKCRSRLHRRHTCLDTVACQSSRLRGRWGLSRQALLVERPHILESVSICTFVLVKQVTEQ
jgi:hypothetical protein